MVVPHGPVRVHNRKSAAGIINNRGKLINQLVHLSGIVEQVVKLAEAILKLQKKGRATMDTSLFPKRVFLWEDREPILVRAGSKHQLAILGTNGDPHSKVMVALGFQDVSHVRVFYFMERDSGKSRWRVTKNYEDLPLDRVVEFCAPPVSGTWQLHISFSFESPEKGQNEIWFNRELNVD